MQDFQKTLKDNDILIQKIKHALIPDQNLVIFIGAGMSIPSGYPSWYGFLKDLIENFVNTNFLTPEEGKELLEGLNAGKYLETAGKLHECNDLMLMETLNDTFKTLSLAAIKGPIRHLPKLNSSRFITTNYDTLLEVVMKTDPSRVFQPRPPARYEFNESLTGGEFVMKLHGTVGNPDTLVLTDKQYKQVYSEDTFKSFLQNLFETKHILFMGCSLAPDHLTEMMASIRQENPHGVKAYAIFAEDSDNQKNVAKSRELNQLGVRPIWLKNPRGKPVGQVYAEQMEPLILYLSNEYIDPLTEEVEFIKKNYPKIFREEAFSQFKLDPDKLSLNQPLMDTQTQALYEAEDGEKWIIEVFSVEDREVAYTRIQKIYELSINSAHKDKYRYILIFYSILHPQKKQLDEVLGAEDVRAFKNQARDFYESGFLSIKGPFFLFNTDIQRIVEKYQNNI